MGCLKQQACLCPSASPVVSISYLVRQVLVACGIREPGVLR